MAETTKGTRAETEREREREREQPEWTEHLGKAFEAFLRDLRGLVPEETQTHLKASQKEFLLALRSLLDREIERLEGEPERKARKVEVK